MNKYKAFGLTIESEIEFHELLPSDCDAVDITIKFGMVPETFEGIIVNNEKRKISKDKFSLYIKGVSKFYVEKGSLILFEPCENSLFEEIKLYLLGSCIGAALYQRKTLPLHGSCVNINGMGVLLTGKTKAGKSTIASALFSKGGKMITDDVAAIEISEQDEVIAIPSYPSQKLWEDAILRNGRKDQIHSLNRVSNSINKYSVKSDLFYQETPIPLKIIFEIIPADVESFEIIEIPDIEKLNIIMKNTYRRLLATAMGMKEWHFRECIHIAKSVKTYRIIRPIQSHLENEIAERILEICRFQ